MILCVDGYNFIHRARGGFQLGPYAIIYNFFRNLRSLVEQFKPNRVYFVTEGKPVRRLSMFEGYKGNRVREVSEADLEALKTQDPKKHSELVKKNQEYKSFVRQKDLIIDLLERCFPISVMRHPHHEADDVIYNLIKKSTTAVPWVVVSNDSDFTQLLNEFDHVKIYNPMLKEFVEKPQYDYVDWKSLRGDGSDNIPSIPGVGDKTADRLMLEHDFRRQFFHDNPHAEDVWAANFDLIKFFEFDERELTQVSCSQPVRDWSVLQRAFEDWQFKSLLKEKTWDKYLATFEPLWGHQ